MSTLSLPSTLFLLATTNITPTNITRPTTTWNLNISDMYNAAIAAYGKEERKNADWYEAHWEEMESMTEAKRKALLAYKASPGQPGRTPSKPPPLRQYILDKSLQQHTDSCR
ncbi:unnamed protein product [Leuciscus chuanchicus]